MPTLTQLEYILAVEKYKHFGKAAKACHVSQPSLSVQIQKVEELLGYILFDRSKKPILTTDLGQKFIVQSRLIINEHKKLLDLNVQGGVVTGKFNLGVIPTLSPYVVPLFVESFSKKYPDVFLNVVEHKTDDIIRLLSLDELDGGILVTPLKEDQIIERHLFYEPFHIYMSQCHALSQRTTIKESELKGEDIWLLSEGHCFRDQAIKICSLHEGNRLLKNINFESGSLETLKNLVKKGCGYTLLPYLATLDLNQEDRSQMLKSFSGTTPTREVSLVHSRSFLKEKIIDALVEEIILKIPEEVKSLHSGSVEVIDIGH